MRHTKHFLRAVSLAVVMIATCARADVIDITPAELPQLMRQGVVLIDVRRAEEWRETGVIAGGKALTFFRASGAFDADAWLAKAREWIPPEQPVALICHAGYRSKLVGWWLDKNHRAKVYNIKGGIAAWLAAGGETQSP